MGKQKHMFNQYWYLPNFIFLQQLYEHVAVMMTVQQQNYNSNSFTKI
jgi:hypothetical protein